MYRDMALLRACQNASRETRGVGTPLGGYRRINDIVKDMRKICNPYQKARHKSSLVDKASYY